jgi:hypothetical protein
MSRDYTYFNGERKVGGTAALTHFIWTVCGGPEEYKKMIIESTLDSIHQKEKEALKRTQLKRVK